MTVFKTVLLAAVVASLGASSTWAETQSVTKLKACGSVAKNSFGSHTEHPAEDEGAGYVSFSTEDVDAAGTKERVSLVNCATRKFVQLNAEYLLTDSSKGLPGDGDLFAFVNGLRKENKLANEALFEQMAKANGYEVTKATLPEKWSEKGKRADCGCKLYYPETMY